MGVIKNRRTKTVVENTMKNAVGGGSNYHAYSTTEQKVGEWIDGSDIYEKTFTNVNFTVSSNVGAWQEITSVDLTGVAQIISGMYFRLSGGLGLVKYDNVAETGLSNNNYLQIGIMSSSFTGTLDTIVLQYTKTTS